MEKMRRFEENIQIIIYFFFLHFLPYFNHLLFNSQVFKSLWGYIQITLGFFNMQDQICGEWKF